MKFTQISIIAVMLVVIAVAIAGCSSSQPATSGSPTPAAAAGAGSAATPAPASGAQSSGSTASSSSATGSQLFGGLNYDWVEYKMVGGGTGSDQMTIYYKYNQKTGKCTMRFEGAAAAAMGGSGVSEMDCSSTGSSSSSSNPNDVKSDVQFVKVGTEIVTVPAGTFTADKYTATYQGTTSTYWIVNGKPLIKMQGGDSTGSVVMELNGMG